MEQPATRINAALEQFAQLVHQNPELHREWTEDRSVFFGVGEAHAASDELAQWRHLEWFLLERHSPSLMGTPADRLLEAWRELQSTQDDQDELAHALLSSFSGVFEVGDVRPGVGAWLRDVAGFGEYALAEPDGAHLLTEGDLLVGRLYPLEGGVHHASRGAGLFGNPKLKAALERDLAQLRTSGGPTILRLAAPELESMFWGAQRVEVNADPVGEARKLLLAGGVDAGFVEELLARLASAPFDPNRLVIGGADVLGEVMNELAFTTDVDLAAARTKLTHAWARLASQPVAKPRTGVQPLKPSPEIDPELEQGRRAAVEKFAAGRAGGQDLEQLFGELERNLDLEGESLDEDPGQAPDFPGVVSAMIEEFRWELNAGGDPNGDRHAAALNELARFAQPIGWFEDLDGQALLRFCAFWIPEKGQFAEQVDVLALLTALEEFCKWAQDAHGMNYGETFLPLLAGLSTNLPRIVQLNREGPLAHANPDDPGELYEVRVLQDHGVTLASLQGNQTEVDLGATLNQGLAVGDRLRARIALDGSTEVYCVYPSEAARLVAG